MAASTPKKKFHESRKKEIHLNCGNLWTMEFLDHVIEKNNLAKDSGSRIYVTSLFGSISRLTPTARSMDRIPFLSWEGIEEYSEKAHNNGINLRYTLNASCIGSLQSFKQEWDNDLRQSVKRLHSIGIHEWTITSPLLCREVKSLFPDDFIEVSTINEVSTVAEIARWTDLGASGVCLSTSINRNSNRLNSIKHHLQNKMIENRDIKDAENAENAEKNTGKQNFQISLLANEACLYKCLFRRECYNLSSHDSFRGAQYFGNYPFGDCNLVRINDPEEWIRARMIAPQWMELYQEKFHIDNFKVSFRTHPYEVAVPILAYYMNGYYRGNLLDLWPTIRHLGNTPEPADSVYISLEKLDKENFINRVLSDGNLYGSGADCDDLECNSSCFFCLNTYNKCKQKNLSEQSK